MGIEEVVQPEFVYSSQHYFCPLRFLVFQNTAEVTSKLCLAWAGQHRKTNHLLGGKVLRFVALSSWGMGRAAHRGQITEGRLGPSRH